MIRIGLCANMESTDAWGVGYERIDQAAALGFDYVELPLAQMMSMPDDAFELNIIERLEKSGIECYACNNFFPAEVRLTGPDADRKTIVDYAKKALALAARAGAKVVVFGSSGARNTPNGTTTERGYYQLAEALKLIAPIANTYGMTIVIEPLNRLESNLINSYMSGLYLAALSAQPNVSTLVDAYHFAMVNDPLPDLATKLPYHVHYAEPLGRRFPEVVSDWSRAFFGQLTSGGYDGCVSIEGYAGADFTKKAQLALSIVRGLTRQ